MRERNVLVVSGQPNDYPVEEVLANMERLIQEGATCYVKFTCSHCGVRQTSSEANSYHTAGYYCEECGELTKPEKINFMMVKSNVLKSNV